jgi:hypothetical protein
VALSILAATALRPEFHRHGSSKIFSFHNGFPPYDPIPVESTEDTPLLHHDSSSESTTRLNRTWLRSTFNIPQIIWRKTGSNLVNVLLVFVPLGIVAGAAGSSAPIVFLLNFLAIIPLASILSFATEELSARLGNTLGGLVNATFGNAVEMIVSRSFRHNLVSEVDTHYRSA